MQLCEVADQALMELAAHVSKELTADRHRRFDERLGWLEKRYFAFTIKRLKEIMRKKRYIPLLSDRQL